MKKNPYYSTLHQWIARRKPKIELCENCHQKPPYDLANISGQYKRDINDFRWLCRSCHHREHNTIKNLKIENRFGKDNPNWKHGKYQASDFVKFENGKPIGKPHCLDCGNKLNAYRSKRCIKCIHKGILNSRYKHGKRMNKVNADV